MATTESSLDTRAGSLFTLFSACLAQGVGVAVPWAAWQARRQYRNDLKRLLRVGPHMIPDVGLKPDEVYAELSKPFWRA